MKKHLLSTSAIALGTVALAAPAAAQEWDVSFGGFMSQHVAYADLSGSAVPAGSAQSLSAGDFDGVDIHSNSEIIFTPSITLDNGLTFGVNVQLETEQNGAGEIDESYMTISSDTLGQIIIGSENSAGYKSMVGAPGVTSMYINSPSISTFIPFSAAYPGGFRQAGLSSFTEVAGNNDVQRLTYFTPSFNGLTLGVSYAPTGNNNVANSFGVNKNTPGVLSDIFDIGVNYSQTFGTTSVTLSGRYGVGDTNIAGVSDPETWALGFQVGFADFTFGGSYAENDNGVANGAGDSSGYSLGMTYDIAGPWAVEALAYIGETDVGASNADYEAYRIGASRDLGPGVDWDIYVVQLDADNGGVGAANRDVSGTVIGTGINLSF
ncbi:Outer membrane protein (porin) [Roseovarius nanhaiticus]|uniref:Outer membrane protein (Porin) n=1 Tax=Roseovarius nanhaiticus TaxID=573024 RepID=A0A1N7H0Z4_9RHOB|nr:porin [Roseovarius nanhaiticus]SEL17082.1 Outer membrane protein (porin) [Roseovarius nanhaiticus]SIS18420.1 Outer membrane protein (porin) [Roseovarius nanhaiticus]